MKIVENHHYYQDYCGVSGGPFVSFPQAVLQGAPRYNAFINI